MPELHILPSPEEAALAMEEFVVALAQERVEPDGRFTIALSGGSTPRRLLAKRLLAAPPKTFLDMKWGFKVDVVPKAGFVGRRPVLYQQIQN